MAMDEDTARALVMHVQALARQMAIPLIIAQIQSLFERGGELYESILGDSIAAAGGWYGMYTPTVYKRGYSFTDERNIQIGAGSITTDSFTWDGIWDVANTSEHVGYSDGFIMRNKKWRPGGYIVVDGKDYEFEIDIPYELIADLWQKALAQVVS